MASLPGKNVVYQSFRDFDVPRWIEECLASVRAWVAREGYEYKFYGDEMFDLLPRAFRKQCRESKVPMSDLGRLLIARALLDEGYDRAIWVDADLFILPGATIPLNPEASYAFCEEIWLDHQIAGDNLSITKEKKTNNAISMFGRGNTFLDFYIDTILQIAGKGSSDTWTFGTSFLSVIGRVCPFELVTGVGVMSGTLFLSLLESGGIPRSIFDQYVGFIGDEIRGMNLGGSNRGRIIWRDLVLTDQVFDLTIHKLRELDRQNRSLSEQQS